MLKNQSNANKVIKGISSQSLVTLFLGILEIISFSIMSRLLTQEDFGYYAAIIAVSVVFSALSDSGIGSALIQRKHIDNKFINNAFTLSLFFGLLASILLCCFSGILANIIADEIMKIPLMLFSVTLLFRSITSINISLMYRRLQYFKVGLIRLISLIITTIIAVILALKGLGLYAILTKVILSIIITFIMTYYVSGIRYKLAFNFLLYKRIFQFSGWLMASSFFRLLSDQIDRLLMTQFFSLNTLGFYTRPKEFITLISEKFCSIFDTALFPILSSIQDENEKLKVSYLYTIYYMNIIGLLLSVIFLFNSELIIRIFLGDNWMNVNSLFQVLSISSLLLMNGRIGDIFLRSLAYTKQQFYLRIGQLIVSVLFIFIGYRWGIIFVAISVMLAQLILVLIKMYYISSKIELSYYKVVITMIKSFKVSIYIIPIYVICYFFFPNSISWNLIKLGIIVISILILFLFFPSLIGTKYKEEAHSKIISIIKQKIRILL